MGRLTMLKCNSCSATYPKPTNGSLAYYHVCPDEIIDQPEQVNDKNEIVKPATRKATPNPRNENLIRHPDKPGEFVLVSEGSGITEVE